MKKKELKRLVYIFLLYKIIIISIAYTSYAIIPEEASRRKHSDPLLDPFAQLDARAYLDIAKNGYNAEFNDTSNYGWYPLYPLLVRLFSFVGYELSAFLIANIFSFFSVVLLYLLVKYEFNEKIGEKSLFYLLFFPSAFFLTAMYSESLFLALVLAMFILANKSKWHYVGLLGFMAALARPQGIIMLIPMAYMYMKNEKKLKLSAIFLVLIPIGLLTLMTYHYSVTGDPFIQFYTHGKYQRNVTLPFVAFSNTIREIFSEQRIFDIAVSIFNVSIALFLTFLAYLSYRELKLEYTLYFTLSLLIPFFSASLASISRFGLVMFPAFMVIALKSEDKKYSKWIMLIYAVFIALLVLGLIRYANEDIIL